LNENEPELLLLLMLEMDDLINDEFCFEITAENDGI